MMILISMLRQYTIILHTHLMMCWHVIGCMCKIIVQRQRHIILIKFFKDLVIVIDWYCKNKIKYTDSKNERIVTE